MYVCRHLVDMDIAIAVLKEVQWTVEDFALSNVADVSCGLCGRLFTSEHKKGQNIFYRNIQGMTIDSAKLHSKKFYFLNLLDGYIVQKVLKDINRNTKRILKYRKCNKTVQKVYQDELLRWVSAMLWTGLIGISKKLKKQSIETSVKQCLSLLPNDRFQEILDLFLYASDGTNGNQLFQDLNKLQHRLASNFCSNYNISGILCVKKYKVDLKDRQPTCDMRLALLIDAYTGYILNFFIYSVSNLLVNVKCIPLIYVLRQLLTPIVNKIVQIDSSAGVSESICEEFLKKGIKLELVHLFSENNGSATALKAEYNIFRKTRGHGLFNNLLDYCGYVIFPLSERGHPSCTFLVVFWLLVHLSCINAFIIHSKINNTLKWDLPMDRFIKFLARELNGPEGHLGGIHRNETTTSGQTYDTESDSDASLSSCGSSDKYTTEHDRKKQINNCGATGLCNLGNTCYMNAILQCLSNTAPLLEYILSWNLQTFVAREKLGVAVSFADLLAKMWFGEDQFVSPDAFLKSISNVHPQFGRRNQQDAHELLIYTLNALHEELVTMTKTSKSKSLTVQGSRCSSLESISLESSIISRLLQGILRHDIVCLACKRKSEKKEVFTVLSLPIPTETQLSLQECLQCFFQQVTLTWADKMFCSFCKQKQDTSVEACIIKPPRIVIFHFKRFEYQGIKRKLNTNITFPLKNLDLSPFLSSSRENYPKYNLYAVVNHSGDVDHGHYTAYCKNPVAKQWNLYDDIKCSNMAEVTVQTSSAYILFYTSQAFSLPKAFTLSS